MAAKMFRQGDVLIVEVGPERAKKLREQADRAIQTKQAVLAEGEVAGHAHRLNVRLEQFHVGKRMFVTVEENEGPGWLAQDDPIDS